MNTTSRIVLISGILLLNFGVLTSSTPAVAQALDDTIWGEELVLFNDDVTYFNSGADSSVPETLSHQESGADWTMGGALTFRPSAGPPEATVQLNANHQSGLTTLNGRVTVSIVFQLRINQVSQPSQNPDAIPLSTRATGQSSASASSDAFIVISEATLNLATSGAPMLLHHQARATSRPDAFPDSDSFDEEVVIDVAPNTVVFGTMVAIAFIGAESLPTGAMATASATINPVFEIADRIIPGTTDNFRDFYEVEFSPGYWALGFPTATTPTSWGRIKSLYGKEPGRR